MTRFRPYNGLDADMRHGLQCDQCGFPFDWDALPHWHAGCNELACSRTCATRLDNAYAEHKEHEMNALHSTAMPLWAHEEPRA